MEYPKWVEAAPKGLKLIVYNKAEEDAVNNGTAIIEEIKSGQADENLNRVVGIKPKEAPKKEAPKVVEEHHQPLGVSYHVHDEGSKRGGKP